VRVCIGTALPSVVVVLGLISVLYLSGIGQERNCRRACDVCVTTYAGFGWGCSFVVVLEIS
jgi:hypothetical protein